MDRGRRRRTAAGLMTLEMGNEPTKRGANFLDSTLMVGGVQKGGGGLHPSASKLPDERLD